MPRAVKNGDAQLPAILEDASLVYNTEREELWYVTQDELWLVPHPYRGKGDKKLDYCGASGWLEKYMPGRKIEKFLAEKGVFSNLPERQREELEWYSEARHHRLTRWLELGPCFTGIQSCDNYS